MQELVSIDKELDAMEEILPNDSNELGLKFFTSNNKGWPNNFTRDDLLNGITHNIYKWTYENTRYSEQILQLTEKGEIALKGCLHTIDKDLYRKIRSGCIQDRSPLEQRDSRLRKYSNNS